MDCIVPFIVPNVHNSPNILLVNNKKANDIRLVPEIIGS
jgi:hypothetical protein